jgi:hypothetical protein
MRIIIEDVAPHLAECPCVNRRGITWPLTHSCSSWRSRADDPRLKHVEFSTAVRLALEDLELGDLSLDLAVCSRAGSATRRMITVTLRRAPIMQRNKVHSVTVISAVAHQLGVEQDLLQEISVGMDREDGVIWVKGLGKDAIMAFTDEGVDELRNLLQIHREKSNPSK